MSVERIVRFAECLSRIGVSRPTIKRWIQAGAFPAPRKLGLAGKRGAVGWLDSEIVAWVARRGMQ